MAKAKTKKNNGWGIAHIPVTSWILFWTLVLATMALAAVCFSSAFIPKYVSDDQATVAAYKAIADNLEKQVNQMEMQSPPPGFSGESCVYETPAPIDNYLTYVYTDPKMSVSMKVPFGTAWLNAECVFPPAKTTLGGLVSFGPVVRSGDEVLRDSGLLISDDTRSLNEVRRAISTTTDWTVTDLRERTVNGIPVLSYHYEGAGYSKNVWIGFGRTYRYELYSFDWLTDAEAIKIIRSLRVVK